MNYYDEIRNKIIENEAYQRVKDYSKERHKVETYFEIGRILNEAGGKYGDNVIGEYARKFVQEFGSSYSRTNLYRMKEFYNLFGIQKVAPLGQQLSWSHYKLLIPIKDVNEINYYVNQISLRKLTKRGLEASIKSDEFRRLSHRYVSRINNESKSNISDYFKNPIIIHSNNKKNKVSEKILHNLILDDLSYFLKELRSGFAYIDDEYPIKLDDRYNYIDFLLYNYKYKYYVVVELKVTELKKEHIGQIKFYMNYIDFNEKSIDDNKTLGIILCAKNNELVVKYSSNENIVPVEYELV